MKRRRAGPWALALVFSALIGVQPKAAAEATPTFKNAYLNLAFEPLHLRMSGTSRLTVTGTAGASVLSLRLAARYQVASVELNGQPVAFDRGAGTLNVELPLAQKTPFSLLIHYAGLPQSGSSEAVYLPPYGDWYPHLPQAPSHTTIRVQMPPRWRALSPASAQDQDGSIGHMSFKANQPPVLAAGLYHAQNAAGVTCWTLGANQNLGPQQGSLKQDAALLAFYRAHGLLSTFKGGQLVEVPGNQAPAQAPGWVACRRPAGDMGFWLATAPWESSGNADAHLVGSLIHYLGDLASGLKSNATARLQALNQYRDFLAANPQGDAPFPLGVKPAPDKGTMLKGTLLWAELQRQLGDKAFFGFLKRLQAQTATSELGWGTIKDLLPEQASWLDSWLQEPGLPTFAFQGVSVSNEPSGYQVSGVLEQTGPMLQGPVSLSLVGLESTQRVNFERFSGAMPFHFVSGDRPVRLLIDLPDHPPVRQRAQLTLQEGLSAPDGLIVYGSQGDASVAEANHQNALALQKDLQVEFNHLVPLKADTDLSSAERGGSLVLVGAPASNSLAREVESQLPVRFMQDHSLWWQGRTYDASEAGVLEIIANPQAPNHTLVLVAVPHAAAMKAALGFLKEPCTFCIYDGHGVVQKGLAMRPFPDLSYPLY